MLTTPKITTHIESHSLLKETVKIREAKKGDLDQLGQLWLIQRTFHQKWDELYAIIPSATDKWKKGIEKALDIPTEQIFVAEDETGKLLGYVAGGIYSWPISPFQKYGSLNTIAVAENARRQGIGKQLALRLLGWFQKEGIRHIAIYVDYRNQVALQLYKSLGFREYQKRLILDLDNN
ncbi:MAG: GNAT family N-acetyltransferase [Candidatus Hermodarchaeota archaeon]